MIDFVGQQLMQRLRARNRGRHADGEGKPDAQHDVLSAKKWEGADIGEVVAATLEPFAAIAAAGIYRVRSE
ncbi:MAG: hypothetical protein WAK39_23680 [Pseudolabrys sp.]